MVIDKKYNFLAGLPRSGNTLLSSILNQNPEIYSSPLSPVSDYMWAVVSQMETSESVLRQGSTLESKNVISNILTSYHSHVDKPIVIDRAKNWSYQDNLDMLKKYVTDSPKILYTTRPILEILASFIKIYSGTPFLNNQMIKNGWIFKKHLTYEDNACDYLMRPRGELAEMLSSIDTVKKYENRQIFFVVEYEDLVSNPSKVMNQIYEFLDINPYKHDYNNINKAHVDHEYMVDAPINMHEVRNQILKTSTPPSEILSEYVLSKYSNLDY
jgi:sulfotransferase